MYVALRLNTKGGIVPANEKRSQAAGRLTNRVTQVYDACGGLVTFFATHRNVRPRAGMRAIATLESPKDNDSAMRFFDRAA